MESSCAVEHYAVLSSLTYQEFEFLHDPAKVRRPNESDSDLDEIINSTFVEQENDYYKNKTEPPQNFWVCTAADFLLISLLFCVNMKHETFK